MQQMLNELEMKSLEEIACVLDSGKTYTVNEVRQMLATDDKGRAYQGIDNCMVVMQYDPVLSGAICHNDLTCKMDIIKKTRILLPSIDNNTPDWSIVEEFVHHNIIPSLPPKSKKIWEERIGLP